MPPPSASFPTRLAIVLALFLSLGVGGFFAIKALDEGTKHDHFCRKVRLNTTMNTAQSAPLPTTRSSDNALLSAAY